MISRHHRTVFVHVPKAAGQSVEMAFLVDLGLDWDRRAELLLRPNDDAALGPPRLAHLTAEDYVALGYLSPEEWRSFFSFAVVRDPYCRAVSLYRHLGPDMTFAAWVATWLTETLAAPPNARARWFVRPQVEFLCDAQGTVLVQDILRFETLATEFERIAVRVKLQSQTLPRRNTTGPRPQPDIDVRPTLATRFGRDMRRMVFGSRFQTFARWQDYYDARTASLVSRLFADDFAVFGYSDRPPET